MIPERLALMYMVIKMEDWDCVKGEHYVTVKLPKVQSSQFPGSI